MKVLKFPSRKRPCPIQSLNDLVRDINALVAVGTERKRKAENAANLRLTTPGGLPRLFDTLVNKAEYRSFKIRVYQIKESVGTLAPMYYATIANLALKKPKPSRLSDEFEEAEWAMAAGKSYVDRRRVILDTHPTPKPRQLKEAIPARIEPSIIEAICCESEFPIPRRIVNAYREFHHEETERGIELLERMVG